LVADLFFFEIVVRVHRRGEHAPYTGLKLGLQVWSHTSLTTLRSDPHARTGEHEG
jgi:hypothetical protein